MTYGTFGYDDYLNQQFFNEDSVRQRIKKQLKLEDNTLVVDVKEGDCPDVGFADMESLLKGLDNVFGRMKRLYKDKRIDNTLKKHGPFIYNFNLNPDENQDQGFGQHMVEGFKAYGLPSVLFGASSRNFLPDSNHSQDHFAWAMKLKNVPFFGSREGGDYEFYEFGNLTPKDVKFSSHVKAPKLDRAVSSYFVVMVHKKTGEIIALPTQQKKVVRLPKTKRAKQGNQPVTYSINTMGYEIPDACDSKDACKINRRKAIELQFKLLYSLIMRRETGTNIVARKNGIKVTFLVAENSWKRFFRNRIDAIASDGKRKRIFHAVVAHERVCHNGKITPVRTHYRGTRNFDWNGYNIKIVMPGRHGMAQSDFNIPGEYIEQVNDTPPSGEETISIEDIPNILDDAMGH